MTVKENNKLFPVFLKLEQLSVLIVGGGTVALEKLTALLQNSPAVAIRLVAVNISDPVRNLAAHHPNIELVEGYYRPEHLRYMNVVVVAVNDSDTSEAICKEAREAKLLVNVADKPELCDFYMSSIVKKGNLKIAISTNGKSPTIAKRLKETLNDALPDQLDDILGNMETIRKKMNGNFAEKVSRLNEITSVLAVKADPQLKISEQRWRKIATVSLFAFFFMIVGHLLFSVVPWDHLATAIRDLPKQIDSKFGWMILTGFLAQLVDGALGMGYGVTCTTILLSMGINLAAISGSIHTAEMFSSGASGYSHYKFGNVNKKLFRALLIPGVLGAILGAYLLSEYGDEYSKYIRPLLAAYTLFLGIKIIFTAFKKNKKPQKIKRVGWLAGAGGFLDSFGGGGWGPLVTSTLISKGRSPRFVIGSVSISEFFVTLASAVTFFSLIGITHWQVIVGLIIGGLIGAPLAAKLVGKLPLKTMFIAVGTMVIIWSLRVILVSAGVL